MLPRSTHNFCLLALPLLVCSALVVWNPRIQSADAPASDRAELAKYAPNRQELLEAYAQAKRSAESPGRAYKTQIAPHWFQNNTRFWYRNELRGGSREFILVDAEHGTRTPAFDHRKLAGALTKAAGMPVQAERLPFDHIEFVDGGKTLQFKIKDAHWKCDLTTYACVQFERLPVKPTEEKPPRPKAAAPLPLDSLWPDGPAPDPTEPAAWQAEPAPRSGGERSPDREWTAFVKDHNVWVRSRLNGQELQLSRDGRSGFAYGQLSWSPDSKTLAACRIEPGARQEVYLIESSPKEGGRAKLHTRPYPLPGDKFTRYELNLFEVATQKQIKPEAEPVDFGTPRPRWRPDDRHFTYQKIDRGHQRFRVMEVDVHTGKVRTVLDEKAASFIKTLYGGHFIHYLDDTDEIVFQSERDGWQHLYLIDARQGTVKNRITKGKWVMRGVERVDEENRQVFFRASGKIDGQDPYLIHHYRVNFDGTGLTALTEANGNHTIQYSPDRKYIIDTYSRVDLPPVHELRRVADGELICELEKADISELRSNGWEAPEVFVAKGRDGETDIWGIICRPRLYDSSKKYPVIEYIYAGPHDAHVPKSFTPNHRFGALTELGFIVVQCDGMGTNNRSKAFHDVCWKNLKDAGFPDRILWHQAAARKYPYYDISRVGIYGTSAGGQNSTGALLFHPDFYKAAVSACGCHDNRMDKSAWNEQWMGYPVGPHYADCSNITNAHKLQGKLLLIVGEMDTNVPPESTLRLADALIKAGKDFELLVVPGLGHSSGGAYGQRRLQDFFVRHLHGVEPPDRNAAPQPGAVP